MVSERASDPVERAMQLMHGLQAERDATLVIPGRGIDRFIARLIDAGVLAIVVYLMTGVAAIAGIAGDGESERPSVGASRSVTLTHWGPTNLSLVAVVTVAVFVAVFVLYELVSHRYLGATPGKRRTQLVIVGAETLGPASGPRLALRTLCWATPLAFGILTLFHSLFYSWGSFAIVFAMYLWSRRDESQGRPLWDVVAGTRVVTTAPLQL